MNYLGTYQPEQVRRLLALGRSLTPEQWDTPSWCDRWTVGDVYGHFLHGSSTPLRTVAAGLVRQRFSLDELSAIESVTLRKRYEQHELLDRLEAASDHKIGPARLFPARVLTADLCLHELDIRRPLGIDDRFSDETLVALLEHLANFPNPVVPTSRRARGLRLEPTDLDWTHGAEDGRVLTGPAEDLVAALAGRRPAFANLDGDGVAVLAERVGVTRTVA